MKFRISDIPDNKSTLELTFDEHKFRIEGFDHDPVELHVEFIKMLNSLQLSFRASTTLSLICDRSLELYRYPITVSYKILFKPNAEPEEDEQQALRPLNTSSNTINIEEEVRDSILLSIPIKKLHPRFLNADGSETSFFETYGNPEDEDDYDEDYPADSRWEALRKLKDDI
ncbi:MAG: DUF177 domain-containing protein [Candidatus Cyclonatronum sp.]|uniref:YceD family protein n=1 Tax=Cyclonatronum sp. TaxID=3024185 RepID=UPI0025C4315C|nr:DUF177 domain-containing protein [Cyclonatronum sp.]MCH8486877.1 DUF177 domain-containing protein [Cyclonatronum sp.]